MTLHTLPRPTAANDSHGRRSSHLIAALTVALLTAACSPSATDSLKEGKAFAEKGDLTAAVISYKNAVQSTPDSLPAKNCPAPPRPR